MTREELIDFAKWLDDGTDYFGESYIQVKTDEYIKAKNIVVKADVSGSVCNYCKGKGRIFHWEFGQFVECVCCRETDR
jgi:hypothetical protein